ncbi:MAG: DUF3971 domain-containing protein [Pseudomonadota bacterium]
MSESSEPKPETPAKAAPKRPRPQRRVVPRWWWWLRGITWVVAAPLVMALIGAVLLIGQEVSAPSWVVRDVEARAAEGLAGGEMTFGEMTITIGRDLHPTLVLRNAVLRDADGAVLARIPRTEALLSPRGALQGRVLPQEITLSGANISLRRAVDGTVALAFEEGARPVGAASDFLGLLDQIDQVFEEGALEALEAVRTQGLIINFSDARANRSWVVDDGRIGFEIEPDMITLRADVALLSGRAFVTTAELSYESPRGSRAAEFGLRLTDAAAADLASQAPSLSWLSVLDAPISGALRGRIDGDGVPGDVSATLQIGEGQVQPNPETRPIPFNGAQTYLTYDPTEERLIFDLIEVDSAWGRIEGSARTYLREFEADLPGAFIGQVDLRSIALSDQTVLAAPPDLTGGSLDFRLRLSPVSLEVGQAVLLSEEASPLHLAGVVQAEPEGWNVALDLKAEEISTQRLLTLWPEEAAPRSRDWVDQNVIGGTWHNTVFSLRTAPGEQARTAMTAEFSDLGMRFMRTLPAIEQARGVMSIGDRRLAVMLEAGRVPAPEGGVVQLAGSQMVIPQTGIPNAPARFDLALDGRVTAMVSLLSLEPFRMMRNSDLPVSFAQGRAEVNIALDTPLGRDVPPEARVWTAEARLRDLRTEQLVPNRVVTSSALNLRADPESLVVQGPVRVDGLGADVTFSRALGEGSEGTAQLEAALTLSQSFLNTFDIRLPPGMVDGQAAARLVLDLGDPASPGFRLTSDLRGIRLALDGLGWVKGRNASGALTIVGALGANPRIDQLSLSAPGLQTSGVVTLAPGGGLERAAFERVRLGGWLDAPVVLIGRGAGRPAAIQIAGGLLDLRDANFGGGGGGGEGGPIDIALDRLQVTGNIAIEDFRGAFTTVGGLQGTFTGTLNGAAPVDGTIVPVDGGAAVRIVSNDAGAVFRASGLLRNAYDGSFDMTLLPAGAEGSYDGTIVGRDLRVRDAPALATLLDAVSVVGLLSQLDGQGILFTDVDASFRLTPNQVILTEASAIGPGLGLSMDGIFSTASGVMDFQGVISPFYALNGIGSVLTRPGEGLIGFNFNLRGPVDSPQVLVNPLSALTPGMFREIFRRPPPSVGN